VHESLNKIVRFSSRLDYFLQALHSVLMIDLHTHTTASDGRLSPSQLVDLAFEKGLKALAITDHDTLGGLEEGREAGKKRGLLLIPGVEIEIQYPEGQFHLLALGMKGDLKPLDLLLRKLKEKRHERNREMIFLLQKEGIPISMEDWEKVSDGIPGRPHLAQLLIGAGVVKNTKEAFDSWLGQDGKIYLPKEGASFEEAISAIHQAQGLGFVAHPQTLRKGMDRLEQGLKIWKDQGLDGIEAYHPSTPMRVGKKYEKLARDMGLKVSAGSDFHGDGRKDRKIGHTCQMQPIEDRFLDEIL